MRLLTLVYDTSIAWEIVSLLNGKGIPTFVKNTRGATGLGSSRYRIFVCIDEHAEDAQALLRNPDRIVRHPVDVEAFQRDARGVDIRQLKWGAIMLVIVVVTILLVTALWLHDLPLWTHESR